MSSNLDTASPVFYGRVVPVRLLLSVAALAALSVAACGAGPAATDSSPGGGRASAINDSDPSTSTGKLVETGPGPVGLAVDSQGRVWVANADAGTVSRLNAAGDGVDLSTPVGNAPLRLATTPGAVWVSVFSDGTLVRLDDDTGRITSRVHVGAQPEGLTAAYGSLWVVRQESATLLRLSPRDGHLVHRYQVGVAPRLVTAGGGAIWVSDFGSGRILRIDPETGQIRQSPMLCSGPQGMVIEAATVWVACTTDDALVAIDRRTLRRTSKTPLPGAPDAITVGATGQLLVALQQGPTLAVVDPAGPTVVRRDRLGHVDQLHDRANIDVVYDHGLTWISSYLEAGVYRLTPG